MESNATTCKSRDILSSRWRVLTLYWLPAFAIVLTGAPAISSGWRTVVWTVALATVGVACIVNALRCGSVHCATYLASALHDLCGRPIPASLQCQPRKSLRLCLAGLRVGWFDPIAEASELPKHSGSALLLGLFGHGRATFTE